MKHAPTVFLLTDRRGTTALAHLEREAAAKGISLTPRSFENNHQIHPENPGEFGIIHLDSGWHLATHREQALHDLCQWVHLARRHAFHLPASLQKLPAEAQDFLGRDLSMLASYREGDFLIVAARELEKSPLLESLKLWLVPQVPIVFHERPRIETSGEGPMPPPDLVHWFE